MNDRKRWMIAAVLTATAWGCGPDDKPPQQGNTNGSTNTSTNGSTNGTNGSTNQWTFQPADEICTVTVTNRSCVGACLLESEYAVDCDDGEFTNPGVRVHATPGGAVLTTSSDRYAFAMDLTEGELKLDNDLPSELVRKALVSQLTTDGKLAVVADASDLFGDDDRGLILAVRDDDGWGVEEIWNSDVYIEPVAFEWKTDGALVWFESDQPSGYSLGTRSGDGTWNLEAAPAITDGYGSHRFTMGADGVPVSFEHVGRAQGFWQLQALAGGTTIDLGPSRQESTQFRVASSPARISAAAAPYVVLLPADDGLHLVGPGGIDQTLPDSEFAGEVIPDCYLEGENPDQCDQLPLCEFTLEGVLDGEYAITRLNDDEVLVAYVYTSLDHSYNYERGFVDDQTEECLYNLKEDNSTARLVVERANLVTGVSTRLVDLPTLPGAGNRRFPGGTDSRGVDIDTDGSHVVVAWRTPNVSSPRSDVRFIRAALE